MFIMCRLLPAKRTMKRLNSLVVFCLVVCNCLSVQSETTMNATSDTQHLTTQDVHSQTTTWFNNEETTLIIKKETVTTPSGHSEKETLVELTTVTSKELDHEVKTVISADENSKGDDMKVKNNVDELQHGNKLHEFPHVDYIEVTTKAAKNDSLPLTTVNLMETTTTVVTTTTEDHPSTVSESEEKQEITTKPPSSPASETNVDISMENRSEDLKQTAHSNGNDHDESSTTELHHPTTQTVMLHRDISEETTTTVTVSTDGDNDASKHDSNTLNNSLLDLTTVSTKLVSTPVPLLVDGKNRKQKQLNADRSSKCPCDDLKFSTNTLNCLGERTIPEPNCPCRIICARQSHQTCNVSMPCDSEFGQQCNLETGLCQGQLSLEVFDISPNSAKIKWGSSKSELHTQATLSYTSTYRGIHTQWIDVEPSKPTTLLTNLMPNMHYFVRIDEDGKQEIVIFQTKDDMMSHPPKILVTQISPSTLTVVWDDFRLPSHHSEYVLEYRKANESAQSWMKIQAGSQPVVTVTQLQPNTAYQVRVAVWEDGDQKLELPSEVVTVNTKDGCVRNNKTYGVNDEFFHGCDFRCMCQGGDKEICSPRCNTPYIKVGSKPDDPMCYEKPLPSDPCCVIVRCTEGKSLESEENVKQESKDGECPEIVEKSLSLKKSCLSDCDHDGDCSGNMKCCPSSCGGAICVLPIMAENICENIYCGPNAKCNPAKMACECSEGFEGNAHDFLNGCKPKTIMKNTNLTTNDTKEYSAKTTMAHSHSPTPSTIANSDNDLEKSEHDRNSAATTETPFELDLASKPDDTTEPSFDEDDSSLSAADLKPVPNSESYNDTNSRSHEVHKSKTDEDEEILNTTDDENDDLRKDPKKKINSDTPTLFDGCEFNNITYDRGVQFEDGCEARCICDRPGHVSCVPRCSILSSGGKKCKEVTDPDDGCCKIMVCSFPGTEDMENVNELSLKILSAQPHNGTTVRIRLALSSSQLPTMVGQDSLEVWFVMATGEQDNLSQWNKRPVIMQELSEVQQGVFEFNLAELMPDKEYFIKVAKERQGSSKLHMAEFSNTVSVKTFPAAVKTSFQGCFHHNQSYNLGEVFYQGCEFKCICRENGFIECQDRCEIYIDTVGYEGCDWIPSEEDHCCMIPSCQRRKIPLLPGSRLPPFVGPVENMCVVNSNEFYRVGDIWELDDGCKTKICRCSMLPNGTTTIQCQSECPALPPNAHIPTARCPNPALVKPDGPCSCPYVSCNEPPRRIVQPPRPQCDFKGKRYDIGHEFHDGCIALCHCSQDLRVSCAAIECPYHFSAEFTNCLEWDIDPNFFPTPPHCCAPSKCKNDGSCSFGGRKFDNFVDIPADLLACGARCVCVNGNVTCENRCPAVEDVPPSNLPCPPSMAYKGHPEGESCCLHWMCKDPPKQAFCTFQGSRYLVSEQWEVGKGSSRRHCNCQFNPNGPPLVECKGGCPQIPQRFLLPSEQCARPVIVTPDDPVMCPYVVCNNTVTAQELYNVNVLALNSTAVRVRFTLANILVGLVGHAELHFTTDPTLPPSEWHIQKFSRPKRLFDSPNIEYILNALRPNTTYFLQIKIKIDALQSGPESELFKLKMPEETPAPITTTLPPIIMLDAKPEAHLIDANTARISWRTFEPQEKKFIYAVQLKYKKENEAEDKWITTPMIHRDVTSYFLHDLEPSSMYLVDMIVTAPKEMMTKLISAKSLEFETMGKTKDDYNLKVSVEENKMEPDSTQFSLTGIPEPIGKYVHVVKISYKTSDGKQSYSFKVPSDNKVQLDHLEPGKKYLAQMELYLTNGRTLTSNEVEFITKAAKKSVAIAPEDNTISGSKTNGKQAELLQSSVVKDDENKAYFVALVVVAVVAAVAGFGFILLLVILVKRQASAKAPISRTPSESAYDNPTYKTYDGERLEDKTNGQAIQTTQA